MMFRHFAAVGLLLLMLWPALDAAWLSFSPDSFLTPPTDRWSWKWYRNFFDDRRWATAILRSFILAITSATVSVLVAAPAAWAVVRHRSWMCEMLKAGMLLPIAIAPVVLGMGLLPVLYRLELGGSPVALVGVHTVIALPLLFWIFQNSFAQRSDRLEAAARGLGASPWQAFRFVTVPLTVPALIAAWICGFLISWNEAIVTVFLTTPSTETLPTLAWRQLKFSVSPLVAVASCISLVFTVLGVGVILRLTKRFGSHSGA
jgi:putative spermidine/putrescine transport system permease protein